MKPELKPLYFHNAIPEGPARDAAVAAYEGYEDQVWLTGSFFGQHRNSIAALTARYGHEHAKEIHTCSQNWLEDVAEMYLDLEHARRWPGLDDDSRSFVLMNQEHYKGIFAYSALHIQRLGERCRELTKKVVDALPNKVIGSYRHFGRNLDVVPEMAHANTLKDESIEQWAEHMLMFEGGVDVLGISAYPKQDWIQHRGWTEAEWQRNYVRITDFYCDIAEYAGLKSCTYTSHTRAAKAPLVDEVTYRWVLSYLKERSDSVCVLLAGHLSEQNPALVEEYIQISIDVATS